MSTLEDTVLEEAYLDVFKALEGAIIMIYRQDPELTDSDVANALENVRLRYRAVAADRPAPTPRLSDRPRAVYDAVTAQCEHYRGLGSDGVTALPPPRSEPLAPAEVIACLKRILRSVKYWTKMSGRRGYLAYIGEFL